jgi:FkbM family methyltransferase
LEEIVAALFRLRQKLFPLNPLSVTSTDAASFFRSQERANARLFEALSPVIEAASTVFDVGANAGFFTKGLLSRFPNFNGRVVLFEPVPHLIEIAAAVLAGRANLEFENTALGEYDGDLELYLPSDGNIGWITPVRAKTDPKVPFVARVSDTKRFIARYKPDVIKIDVEGYELFVLRPIIPFINDRYKPTFLVEVGWGKSNPNWGDFLLVVAELSRLGYQFHHIDGQILSLDDVQNLNRTTDLRMAPS